MTTSPRESRARTRSPPVSSPASRSRRPKRIPRSASRWRRPSTRCRQVKQKKAPRYTPVSKRQDKPDAVYWILRNHPEFTDADIVKMVGTTKSTIQKIRERSHWNIANIKPVDPVTLGLCTQFELDLAVERAGQRRDRAAKRAGKAGETLKPIEETTAGLGAPAETVDTAPGAEPDTDTGPGGE